MREDVKLLRQNVMIREIPIGGYFYKNYVYKKLKNSSFGGLLNNHYGCLYVVNLDTNEIEEFDELTFVIPLEATNKQTYKEDYNFERLDNNEYMASYIGKDLEKILINKIGDTITRSRLNSVVDNIFLNSTIYEYKTKIEFKNSVLFVYVES